MRLYTTRFFLVFIVGLLSLSETTHAQKKQGWKDIFNGKDLTGWDTYLRATNIVGYDDPDPAVVPYEPPIGLNNDPLNVFTVQNGLLRISGEIWGAITTKEIYGNYHLRFVTKWGEKKYAPKDNSPRDAGLLFHCTEGFDYAFKCWMRSMEMQIQEGEIGDFFNVGGGEAEVHASETTTMYNETSQQYDPSVPLRRYPGRLYRSGNFESPAGEWTTSEMVARQADAVFIVNGFVVNRLFNIYRHDLLQQVTRGKIQFQSEGAEHFYKSIQIRPISFEQRNPVLQTAEKKIVLAEGETKQITVTNQGEAVEIIAVELIGKDIEQFVVKLPSFPLVFKKGVTLNFPVSLKSGGPAGNSVKFRLETLLGPVADFEVELEAR